MREIIATRKIGKRLPGTKFFAATHVAKALVAIGHAEWANKALTSSHILNKQLPPGPVVPPTPAASPKASVDTTLGPVAHVESSAPPAPEALPSTLEGESAPAFAPSLAPAPVPTPAASAAPVVESKPEVNTGATAPRPKLQLSGKNKTEAKDNGSDKKAGK